MTHSFRSHYFHLIWSTRNRESLISRESQFSLYAYMGGVIKNYDGKLIEAGGTLDHVHLLVGLNLPDKFSDFIRDLKTSSSSWLKKNSSQQHFAWQDGYGSFSVSYSSLEKVKQYIKNQEEHHKTKSFDEEYMQLLKKHKINFDTRFVLG
jgi:putative transposase